MIYNAKKMSFSALSAIGASAPIAIGVSTSSDAASIFLNASKRKDENVDIISEYRTLRRDLALRKHALRNMLFRIRDITQNCLSSTHSEENNDFLIEMYNIFDDAKDTVNGIRTIIESLSESNMVTARVSMTLGIPRAIVRGRIIPDEHAYELQALDRVLGEIYRLIKSVKVSE